MGSLEEAYEDRRVFSRELLERLDQGLTRGIGRITVTDIRNKVDEFDVSSDQFKATVIDDPDSADVYKV
jgi:hypothetical protein